MTDPVPYALLAILLVLIAATDAFRRLKFRVDWVSAPLVTGVAAGLAIAAARRYDVFPSDMIRIAIPLTIAVLSTGRRSEATDTAGGFGSGAILGIGAALPVLLLAPSAFLTDLATLPWAAAAGMAGFALSMRFARLSPLLPPLISAFTIFIVSIAVPFAITNAPNPEKALPGLMLALPLTLFVESFVALYLARRELLEEARLGLMQPADLAATLHPFRRFGRGGWINAQARRRFVQLAQELALRKRSQRSAAPEVARIHQLDILKLRMEMREMEQIERAMRAQPE